MSTPCFTIFEGSTQRFGSNRFVAMPLRRELEVFLRDHETIIISFRNVPDATQSWVDELIGKLIFREGKVLLKRVQFQDCSQNLQELIKFVISDRIKGHEKMQSSLTCSYNPSSLAL